MERTTIVEKKSFTNFRETNPYLKTHLKIFVIKKDPTAGSPTKNLVTTSPSSRFKTFPIFTKFYCKRS